jgi:hypothetical protein
MEAIEDHVAKALDLALELTFPASDPIAVTLPDATERQQREACPARTTTPDQRTDNYG